MKVIIGGLVVLTFAISPAQSADHPGKAVFENTCKRCHGEDGGGDRIADKFYQVAIPRLNSEEVQKKSDADLKEIITKGKGKMEPVRPGTPSVRHTFTGDWVDDVIGYVRTLKKEAPAR